MKIAMPLVCDFELLEMTASLDILRRADILVDTISLESGKTVKASNNCHIVADKNICEVNLEDYDAIVLTGGKGTDAYKKHNFLKTAIINLNDKKKLIAAICQAPKILANLGILKKATIFPSYEFELVKNNVVVDKYGVVVSDNIITATSVNYSIEFALEIVAYLLGNEKKNEIEKQIVRTI